MTLVSTFSIAALFPAVPEIAAEYGTTGEVINITNAAVFVAMGMSTLIYGPLALVCSRKFSFEFVSGCADVEIDHWEKNGLYCCWVHDVYLLNWHGCGAQLGYICGNETFGWLSRNLFHGCWSDYHC